MDTDILAATLALVSAFFFGLAKQIQNLGLGYTNPRDGTLIAIASTTLLFWLFSPLYLQADYWFNPVVLSFVFIGILRPILSDNAENFGIKYLGPSLSSAITATSPVFASILAVIILGEILTPALGIGITFIILGIIVSSVRGEISQRRGQFGQLRYLLQQRFHELQRIQLQKLVSRHCLVRDFYYS